jgi:hypothetical protein
MILCTVIEIDIFVHLSTDSVYSNPLKYPIYQNHAHARLGDTQMRYHVLDA